MRTANRRGTSHIRGVCATLRHDWSTRFRGRKRPKKRITTAFRRGHPNREGGGRVSACKGPEGNNRQAPPLSTSLLLCKKNNIANQLCCHLSELNFCRKHRPPPELPSAIITTATLRYHQQPQTPLRCRNKITVAQFFIHTSFLLQH